MDLTVVEYVIAGAAAFAAGGVNSLAGGGTLISFPALLAIDVAPVAANVTNTVALCPGYFGAAVAQRDDLADQRHLLRGLAAAAALGGLAGSVLLVLTSDEAFEAVVPFLILAACVLLGVQDRVRAWLRRRREARAQAAAPSPPLRAGTRLSPPLIGAVAVAAVYGGYFGAGLGIMLLAVLGVLLDEALTRVNALKSALSLVINVVAAVFFIVAGEVEWRLAPLMALAALVGGTAGGRLASRVPAQALRVVVIAFGLAVAVGSWL